MLTAEILLDLHNLYTDEVNLGIDAEKVINYLPPDRIIQIHLAGGYMGELGLYWDGHCTPVKKRVFQLLECTLRRANPSLIVLERENRLEGLGTIMSDLEEVWRIWKKVRGRESKNFSLAA